MLLQQRQGQSPTVACKLIVITKACPIPSTSKISKIWWDGICHSQLSEREEDKDSVYWENVPLPNTTATKVTIDLKLETQ